MHAGDKTSDIRAWNSPARCVLQGLNCSRLHAHLVRHCTPPCAHAQYSIVPIGHNQLHLPPSCRHPACCPHPGEHSTCPLGLHATDPLQQALVPAHRRHPSGRRQRKPPPWLVDHCPRRCSQRQLSPTCVDAGLVSASCLGSPSLPTCAKVVPGLFSGTRRLGTTPFVL